MVSGWRAPVFELGTAGLTAALVFYFFANEEPAHEQPKNRPAHHEKLFPVSSLWIFFLAAAFAFSLRDFTGSSMGSLGSLFLQKAHRLNPSATGWILSTIFVASAISNPLFGRLSDRGLIKWMLVALGAAAVVVFSFPHVPVRFSAIVLAVYGFFFMASYPMVEGALMASMPHHVRGRIFGIFITVGGIVGNLAHWMMGAYVKHLGPAATRVESYYGVYAILACLLLLALLGLPCLLKVAKSGVQRSEIAPVFATLKD
jgi:predicted MFS family arabinose efflux permease